MNDINNIIIEEIKSGRAISNFSNFFDKFDQSENLKNNSQYSLINRMKDKDTYDIVIKYFPNGKIDIDQFFDHDFKMSIAFYEIFYYKVEYLPLSKDDGDVILYEQKISSSSGSFKNKNFLNVVIFNYNPKNPKNKNYDNNIKIKLIKMLDEMNIQFPIYYYSTSDKEILDVYYANIKRFLPPNFTNLNENTIVNIVDNIYSSIFTIGVLDTDHFNVNVKPRVINFIFFLINEKIVDINILKKSLILRFNDNAVEYLHEPLKKLYNKKFIKLYNLYRQCYILFINEIFEKINDSKSPNTEDFNLNSLIFSKIYDLKKIYHTLFFNNNNYGHFLRYKNLFDNKMINELIILQNHFNRKDKISLQEPIKYDDKIDYLSLFINHTLFLYLLYPNFKINKNINYSQFVVDVIDNNFTIDLSSDLNLTATKKDYLRIEHKKLGSVAIIIQDITKENILDNEIDPLFIANIFWLNSFIIKDDMIKFPKISENKEELLDELKYYIESCFDVNDFISLNINFKIDLDQFDYYKLNYFYKIIYIYKVNSVLIFDNMCLF
jgi:hypothetical protein